MRYQERRVKRLEVVFGTTSDYAIQNEALFEGLKKARMRVTEAGLTVPPALELPPEADKWGFIERLRFARAEAQRRISHNVAYPIGTC